MDRICFLAAFSLLYISPVELLTQNQRNDILNYHNEKRQSVSPSASNMENMVYDMDLENLAQEWVNRCKFEHPSRGFEQYKASGQNIAASTGRTDDGAITTALESWYNEKDDYNYATKGCTGVCGHYTQMVWHDSNKIGCAMQKCTGIFAGEANLIACQYVTRGNFNGQRPYDVSGGTPEAGTPGGGARPSRPGWRQGHPTGSFPRAPQPWNNIGNGNYRGRW